MTFRLLTLNASIQADLLFSRPGMYSYNLWSGVPHADDAKCHALVLVARSESTKGNPRAAGGHPEYRVHRLPSPRRFFGETACARQRGAVGFLSCDSTTSRFSRTTPSPIMCRWAAGRVPFGCFKVLETATPEFHRQAPGSLPVRHSDRWPAGFRSLARAAVRPTAAPPRFPGKQCQNLSRANQPRRRGGGCRRPTAGLAAHARALPSFRFLRPDTSVGRPAPGLP